MSWNRISKRQYAGIAAPVLLLALACNGDADRRPRDREAGEVSQSNVPAGPLLRTFDLGAEMPSGKSNVWGQLAALPEPRSHAALVTAGTELVLIGGRDHQGQVTPAVFRYDAASDRWSVGEAMPEGRAALAGAVVAPDGSILVFGGVNASGQYSRTTFQFVPETGMWRSRAPLPAGGGCGSAAASDSLVFVFVGCDTSGAPTRAFYAYDPSADVFTVLPAPSLHHTFGALVAARGELLLTGGKDSAGVPSAAVERYVAGAEGWDRVPGMSAARAEHGAVFVRQSVVVTGGTAPDGEAQSASEYLDPATRQWHARAPLARPRAHAGVASLAGRVIVAGGVEANGSPVATVDALTHGDFWLQAPPTPTVREATVSGDIGGVIYVIGGFERKKGIVATNEAFDTRSGTWKTLAPMPAPRAHSMATVAGGKLYVIGGNDQSPPSRRTTNSVFAYDPATDTWETRAAFPVATWGGTAVTVGDAIVATAGSDGDVAKSPVRPELYRYDPQADAWSLATRTTGRTHGAMAAVLEGKLYLVGGHGTINARDDMRVYDTRSRTWSDGASKRTPTTFLAVAAVNGALYAIGGSNRETYAMDVVERFDPRSGKWSTVAPLPLGLVSSTATTSGGLIYVVGGKTPSKGVTPRVFVYVP